MKLIPLNGKVVIKPTEPENKIGKLILPANKDEKRPEQGTIVAKCEDVELGIKVGDLVLFDKYNADIYTINDKKLMIVSSSDLHAIVRKT